MRVGEYRNIEDAVSAREDALVKTYKKTLYDLSKEWVLFYRRMSKCN